MYDYHWIMLEQYDNQLLHVLRWVEICMGLVRKMENHLELHFKFSFVHGALLGVN